MEVVTRRQNVEVSVNTVPYKRRGRPLLLGEEADTKVQMYLRKFEKEEVEYGSTSV